MYSNENTMMDIQLENLYKNTFGYIRDISSFKNIIKVYNEDDILIGSVGIEKDYNDIILLTAFCVLKNNRNNGIGTKLLNIVSKKYKNIPLALFVDKHNNNYDCLINFYRKRGFITLNDNKTYCKNISYDPSVETLLYNSNLYMA